jgi:hypothetical protein
MMIFQKRVILISGVCSARVCFQPFLDRLKNPNTYFDSPKSALTLISIYQTIQFNSYHR